MSNSKYKLEGQVFTRLTVIKEDGKDKHSNILWLCQCSCADGTILHTGTQKLVEGMKKSCGCLQREKSDTENLTGRVFNRLTCLFPSKTKWGRSAWLCRCICGNLTTVETTNLKNGTRKSCGCIIHEISNSEERRQRLLKSNIGRKRTPEQLEKMSQITKDWFKDPRNKEKMQEVLYSKRKPTTEKTKQKLYLANKGRKPTPESLKKMSETKKAKGLKGEKHWAWKGGKGGPLLAFRRTVEINEWRRAVYERDNYTCQECGQVGGKLNADHIIPLFKLAIDLNLDTLEKVRTSPEVLDINNGKTLCRDCHEKTDSFGNKGSQQAFALRRLKKLKN